MEVKMDGNIKSVNTGLEISEDVIITAAKLAALDVKGVAGLNGEVNCLSKLSGNGPIKITYMGDVIAADVRILVESSERACVVAENVQKAVKENIQNMLGVTVARVNVTVDGIEFK
jgi:uncharacterized alkaline shock family protein YloU